MSPMRIIILLVAAAAAIAAGLMVRNISQPAPVSEPASESAAPAPVTQIIETPQTPVLVAVRDLRMGELLIAEDFEWRDWPDATLNPNYYTQDAFPEALDDLAGSVVRSPIFESEPILPQKLVQKGETGYMAAMLTPGFRAVSVEISTDNASGGFILPNDRVDILVTYEVELIDLATGEKFNRPTTSTILENVRVLAIDQLYAQTQGGQYVIGSTATLELRPDESKLIAMAERMGTISLALRALRDATQHDGPVNARTDFLIDIDPYGRGGNAGGGNLDQVTVYRGGDPMIETPGGGS